MIEPSTSQSGLADSSTRDRRTTGTAAQIPPREFARVLENQVQGRVSMNDADGTKAFSEGGLFQHAVAWLSDRATPPVAAADVLEKQQDTDRINANEGSSKTIDGPGEPSGPTKVGDDAVSTVVKAGLHPIVAKQQASPCKTSSPSQNRVRTQPSRVPQKPPAGTGARLLNRSAAASLPLHVAVAAIEHGVVVRIATTALEDVERRDLAHRIAELLARHGYAGGYVSVNGVTTNLPSHEGQDTWR